jgi:hypothetical protein
MRLLFLATVVSEHHEVAMGIDLANQIRGEGIESHFVVHPYNEQQTRSSGHPYTCVSPEMPDDVREVVRRLVAEWAPDAIVLSDYIAHWLTFTYSYELDPWFVEDLGVPIIPMDLYELEEDSLQLEIMGRTAQVSDRILRMPARLRPVPVAHPESGDEHAFAYRVGRASGPINPGERARVRGSLGLTDRDRLLVLPGLDPQHAMIERAGGPTRELAIRVPELVVSHLRKLPENTHFLFAGPTFDAFRELPADRTHLRPGHSAAEHDAWVRSADAVWATYFPAGALELAALSDVPGLLTTNGFDVEPETGADRLAAELGGISADVRCWLGKFSTPVPAFTLWPWRWRAIMRPVLWDNPFVSAGCFAELLDERSVVACLGAMLDEPRKQQELAQTRSAYLARLDRLPATAEVVRSAARRAGVRC